jgi:hypothetical protein
MLLVEMFENFQCIYFLKEKHLVKGERKKKNLLTGQEYSIFQHVIFEINGLFNRLVTTLVVHYLMKSCFTLICKMGIMR